MHDSLTIALLQAREAAMAYFRPIVKRHNLTEQQWRIVRILAERPSMDFHDLAFRACILRPSLTGILTRMERDGLVLRLKPVNDQRKLYVSLTPAGTALYESAQAEVEETYRLLEAQFTTEKLQQLTSLLDVLIELGVPGGRCGCRSVDDALALAQRVSDLPGLRLRGLELYEGVLHGDDPQPQVEALLQQAAALACRMEPLVDGEFILTGAGTVWYDVVCNIWLAAAKPRRCRIVIRPGCYITHDRGIYDLAQQELIARDPIACDLAGDLTSALELMAMVQSVPEADRAVVNFGKRDCAFDAGLPQPIAHYRNGQELALRAESIVSTGIMDQHCMLRLAPGSDVQVGDILLFGTSHPCLTFDKWKTLLLVDDDYNVLDELDTLF